MAPRYEMVVGMEKGKKTTKIEAAPAPVKSKGACTKHSKAVRDLVRTYYIFVKSHDFI